MVRSGPFRAPKARITPYEGGCRWKRRRSARPQSPGRPPTGIASSRPSRTSTTTWSTRWRGGCPRGWSAPCTGTAPARTRSAASPTRICSTGTGCSRSSRSTAGRIRYRNRFVRTTHYLAERAADKPVMRNYGQQRPGGPLANALRTPANVANTSVQYHAGNLLALYEGGRPWQLDPDTLETIGEYDFDGELKGSLHVLRPSDLGSRHRRALQLRHPVRPAHEAAHVPGRLARAGSITCTRSRCRSRRSTTTARSRDATWCS